MEIITVDEWDEIKTELDELNPFNTMYFGGIGSFVVQNGTKALNYNGAQNTSKKYDFTLIGRGLLVAS